MNIFPPICSSTPSGKFVMEKITIGVLAVKPPRSRILRAVLSMCSVVPPSEIKIKSGGLA